MEYNFNNNDHSHYQLILLFNYSLGCHGIGNLKDINISRVFGVFLKFPMMLPFRCIQVMDCFTVAVTNTVRFYWNVVWKIYISILHPRVTHIIILKCQIFNLKAKLHILVFALNKDVKAFNFLYKIVSLFVHVIIM